MDETPRRAPRMRRHYKIQEVIKRRQVLLVQVVKEERGNKGAALTTYLSLAGRYSVLMPNTARGGGISRKITNAQDRSRLKSIAEELEVPDGMGVILRTAGASRTKPEVKRDFEYLLRMWETVRETTLASSAPTLVYEEGSLIKRAIRDLYSKDVEEIVVAGEAGYREAKAFMRLLMPNHVKAVVPYRDTQPVFAKAGVEAQLDAMFSNQVTLKSGGYIVINQTEALVAIDVNSGRSTREHNIEDTALRTNLEAADEIARQLRLRDLAGLIVVDFIDMEESRNNRSVERRMKDALKNDRARIQVGRISHFGLLEMSRQRIRTGVLEGSTVVCQHCQGAGVVRSTSSVALHVLRVLEDALIKSVDARHDRARAHARRALHPQSEARAPARSRAPLRRDDPGRGGRHADRRELSRARARRARVRRQGAGRRARASARRLWRALGRRRGIRDRGDARGGRRGSRRSRPSRRSEDEDDGVDGESETERSDAPKANEDEAERTVGGDGADDGAAANVRPAKASMADAPQPTDDGLAAVAEIGGDFATPAPTAREKRARRFEPTARAAVARAADGAASAIVSRRWNPRAPSPNSNPRRARSTRRRNRRWRRAPSRTWRNPNCRGASRRPSRQAPQPFLVHAEEPTPPAEPAAAALEEPARPRRSGWWQRARATLVGD